MTDTAQPASRSDDGKPRMFHVCTDHRNAEWNQPQLDGDDCVLCRLFYLEAQESLLEEWQQRAKRAEEAIAEIQRPLDSQMARLNENLIAANDRIVELERAAAVSEQRFIPTHVHADGGRYRLHRMGKYKTSLSGWTDAVIYEAEDRNLYVTTPARWSERFAPINEPDASGERHET